MNLLKPFETKDGNYEREQQETVGFTAKQNLCKLSKDNREEMMILSFLAQREREGSHWAAVQVLGEDGLLLT